MVQNGQLKNFLFVFLAILEISRKGLRTGFLDPTVLMPVNHPWYLSIRKIFCIFQSTSAHLFSRWKHWAYKYEMSCWKFHTELVTERVISILMASGKDLNIEAFPLLCARIGRSRAGRSFHSYQGTPVLHLASCSKVTSRSNAPSGNACGHIWSWVSIRRNQGKHKDIHTIFLRTLFWHYIG